MRHEVYFSRIEALTVSHNSAKRYNSVGAKVGACLSSYKYFTTCNIQRADVVGHNDQRTGSLELLMGEVCSDRSNRECCPAECQEQAGSAKTQK